MADDTYYGDTDMDLCTTDEDHMDVPRTVMARERHVTEGDGADSRMPQPFGGRLRSVVVKPDRPQKQVSTHKDGKESEFRVRGIPPKRSNHGYKQYSYDETDTDDDVQYNKKCTKNESRRQGECGRGKSTKKEGKKDWYGADNSSDRNGCKRDVSGERSRQNGRTRRLRRDLSSSDSDDERFDKQCAYNEPGKWQKASKRENDKRGNGKADEAKVRNSHTQLTTSQMGTTARQAMKTRA
jgi:hypothetical protein